MKPPAPSVFVFVMQGCGHCHEYVPKLRRAVKSLGAGAPKIFVGDISKDASAQKWATLWKVDATPTTIAINAQGKRKKALGAVGDAEIKTLLGFAK